MPGIAEWSSARDPT